ncbi:MAG: DMT family transporter [Bdellovibrionales bacterium]|nr:DMT family transporter [Bdellovibrionales bacterium]
MHTGARTPPRLLVLGALVVVQVLFGLNYVVSKVVVGSFPPLVWASLRIIVSSALMVGLALLMKRPHPTDGRKFFGPLVWLALLGTVINQACFLVGLKHTTASNSAILNTLIPVFTLLVVTIRGQESLGWKRVVGFLFAFAGVLVLRNVEHFTLSDETAFGDLLTLINCLSFALFLSFSRKFIREHDRVWTTAWLFIYGSVGITALAGPDWAVFTWPEMTPRLWGAATFAIVGGTLLTYFLNNWTLAYARSTQVALFVYIQPVVAGVFAWFWLDQPITPRMVAASLLIFMGVILVLRRDSGHDLRDDEHSKGMVA